MSEPCGACAGSGRKPGRFMTPCDCWPCPMCNGKGRGGRAAGVLRTGTWTGWRPDGLEGARARTDGNLEGVFG